MLRYESVGMRYADGTMALDSVSLRVPRGQFCVILGASGAGKSTLLRMANGLTTPTQGQVWVDDTEVRPSTLAAVRPRIGMVHQHFNLVSRATVATNVLSGALPGLPAWRAYLLRFPPGCASAPVTGARSRPATRAPAPPRERAVGRPAAARRHRARVHAGARAAAGR